MLLVLLYTVVDILLSAFLTKKRWKLAAVIHAVLLTVLLVLLASVMLSDVTAGMFGKLTGREISLLQTVLAGVGGAFALAPVAIIEAVLFIQAVFTGLLAVICTVEYIRGIRKQTNIETIYAEKPIIRLPRFSCLPERRLWQEKCVMRC